MSGPETSREQGRQSLWGVRHYNGISTILRIAPPYTDWSEVLA